MRGSWGIGHIKLYIKGRSGYLRGDTLGSKYGIHIDCSLSGPERSFQMTVNAIALGVGKKGVNMATWESIAKKYELLFVEEKSDRTAPPHRV